MRNHALVPCREETATERLARLKAERLRREQADRPLDDVLDGLDGEKPSDQPSSTYAYSFLDGSSVDGTIGTYLQQLHSLDVVLASNLAPMAATIA